MPTLRRKIIRAIGYLLLILIIGVFIYISLNFEVVKADLNEEIRLYGAYGILITAFVVDLLWMPIGPEVPVIGGLLAGIPIPTVLFNTIIGSAAASILIYAIGYFFGEFGALHYMSKDKFEHWKRKYLFHRRLTLSLGALTPVPYVPICLVGGVFKSHFWEFALFAIGARTVRIIGVAYIILLLQGKI